MDKHAAELQKEYWNKQHLHYERQSIKTDNWLKRLEEKIKDCQMPILDLGCGSGNNLPYLLNLEKTVIPCDYSELAVENIRKNFPEIARVECFDMTSGLPFPDNFTEVVLADLSLHYFNESTTFFILSEIQRVLKPNGTLSFRVNSMNDVNYGAGVGVEVEKHYYFTGKSSYKRFFDERDIRYFLKEWHLNYLEEKELFRYDMPKMVWYGEAEKR